jgi:hypothetical protein
MKDYYNDVMPKDVRYLNPNPTAEAAVGTEKEVENKAGKTHTTHTTRIGPWIQMDVASHILSRAASHKKCSAHVLT